MHRNGKRAGDAAMLRAKHAPGPQLACIITIENTTVQKREMHETAGISTRRIFKNLHLRLPRFVRNDEDSGFAGKSKMIVQPGKHIPFLLRIAAEGGGGLLMTVLVSGHVFQTANVLPLPMLHCFRQDSVQRS